MDSNKKKDKGFLGIAIELAEKARGFTGPNPLVGAVIVKDGQILSTGYHKKAGGPHAEIIAIDNAKAAGIDDFSSCDIYVSLEPCSIFSKTPPCTDAIIKEGFRSVIFAARDPNPLIDGKGLKKLRDAGIIVREGMYRDRVRQQNEVFFKNITRKKPFISCKIASSIDAKLATRKASSKWITSEESRKYSKKLRLYNDCIITGINTVIEDDPMLVYDGDFKERKKYIRAVMDTRLRIPVCSKIVKSSPEIPTVVFYSKKEIKDHKRPGLLRKKGVMTLDVPTVKDSGRKSLCISAAIEALFKEYGAGAILIEAGPSLVTSFLKDNLIDKFYFFLAPKIIGGDSTYGMFGALGIDNIKDSLPLEFKSVDLIGDDILITAYPTKSKGDQ